MSDLAGDQHEAIRDVRRNGERGTVYAVIAPRGSSEVAFCGAYATEEAANGRASEVGRELPGVWVQAIDLEGS